MNEKPSSSGAYSPKAHSATKPKGLRILIVEDDLDALQGLREWLRVLGHESWSVSDGLSALEAARYVEPDLILLDIDLPGVSGHEVARILREDRATQAIKLIAMTGCQAEEQAHTTMVLFDHYLVKPIDLDALGAMLVIRHDVADERIPSLRTAAEPARVSENPAVVNELTDEAPPLLAILAHELRQPLSAMSGYLASAKRLFGTEAPADSEFPEFLVELDRVFRRSQALVELIGETALWTDRPCGLNRIVNTAVQLFRVRPQGRKFEFDFEPANFDLPLNNRGKNFLFRTLLDLLNVIGRHGGRTIRVQNAVLSDVARVTIEVEGLASHAGAMEELRRIRRRVNEMYRKRRQVFVIPESAVDCLTMVLTVPREAKVEE